MSVASTIFDSIKRHFLSGVLVVVPFILTFIVLRFLFEAIDGILQPVLRNVLGYYRTGLGVLTTILLILLAGVMMRSIVGHRLYRFGDWLLVRVPLIRPIYSASKQLLEGLTGAGANSFKEVAMIEYPRVGLYSLCFITQRATVEVRGEKRQFAACFVPSTPTPVSGMTVMVPVDKVIPVNMTVEEGVKFFVSGGVASPLIIAEKDRRAMISSEGE
jgi:uncharacterized membrane protein